MDGIFTDDELKAATEANETLEKDNEQPRDEHGRFAPKEPEAADEQKPADTAVAAETQQGTIEEKPDKSDNKVPQGALHAERERRKSVEAELKRVNEQLQALAKLREQVTSRQPEPKPAEPTDETGVQHLTQRLAELEKAQSRVSQERDLEKIETAENEQIGAVVAQSEALYRQVKPDYDDAIRHVVQARAQELALYGYNELQIRKVIGNEITDVAKAAIAQGKDPAEFGYQVAMSRGYRPGPGEAQPANTGQAQIDAIENAKSQSRSLGQAAGASPKQMTIEAVLQMPQHEFEALYATAEGKRLIDQLGGAQ